MLAQRVLEAVFGDQAIRRLAQTAKDDLDGRVWALLADELVRYHMILERTGRGGRSIDPVLPGGSGGGVRPSRWSARQCGSRKLRLPPGQRRLAIDAPTVSQIPSREATDDSEIVDAEPRSAWRGDPLMAARGLGLLSRKGRQRISC